MKFIASLLIFCSFALNFNVKAQTPTDIQNDFNTTFNNYYSLALKFVDGLANLHDQRVKQYIAAHEKLIEHYKSIRTIPGIQLSNESEKVLDNVEAKINELIADYNVTLDRNIFTRELNKYIDILKTRYLDRAQSAIGQLQKFVTANSAIGKCWSDNSNEILNVITTALVSAKDAAILTIANANATLNSNEVQIKSMISTDDVFIATCQSDARFVSSCVGNFLNLIDFGFPLSAYLWELTTSGAVRSNLNIAEVLIMSATETAVTSITSTVVKIESCIRGAMG